MAGRAPTMTKETAPSWLRPMWVDFADVSAQFMDKQPRSREQVSVFNDGGGKQRNGCCNHKACRVGMLGHCRLYKLYCLDRLGDVRKSQALKVTGEPVVEREDLPWLSELERRRKIGEPYQTYREFRNGTRNQTQNQVRITEGGNDNMATYAHSNRQEVSYNSVPPPEARDGLSGTDRSQHCNMVRTPEGFEATKQIDRAARDARARRAAETDASKARIRIDFFFPFLFPNREKK